MVALCVLLVCALGFFPLYRCNRRHSICKRHCKEIITDADVMYIVEAVEPLVATLRDLLKDDGTALVAHGRNCSAGVLFSIHSRSDVLSDTQKVALINLDFFYLRVPSCRALVATLRGLLKQEGAAVVAYGQHCSAGVPSSLGRTPCIHTLYAHCVFRVALSAAPVLSLIHI